MQGVVIQARDTEKRCDKLLALHRDFHRRLKGGSVRLAALIDRLFDNPAISVKTVQKLFSVSYPTAHADLKKLEAVGIVKPAPKAPIITYYCEQIFEVTYEDIT